MSNLAFDTHRFIKNLTGTGMEAAQAEVLADTYADLLTDRLATKEDIAAVQKNIDGVRSELKKDIAAVQSGLQKDIVAVQKDIDGVRNELKKDIAAVQSGLQKDIDGVRNELKKDIAAVQSGLQKDIAAVQTSLQKDIVTSEERLKGSQFHMALMVAGIVTSSLGFLILIIQFYGG